MRTTTMLFATRKHSYLLLLYRRQKVKARPLAHALYDESARRARRPTADLVRMAMLSPHGVLHIRLLHRVRMGIHTKSSLRLPAPAAVNGVGERDSLACVVNPCRFERTLPH